MSGEGIGRDRPRPLGALWNQNKDRGDLYVRARDPVKAAALEAAIEFEDEIEGDFPERMVMDETKGPALSALEELVEIATRMKKDKARLEELCRQLAELPTEGTPRARKTGRKTLASDRWKKVICPDCKEPVGSRVYDGQRYPVLHSHGAKRCPGSFKAVAHKEVCDE